MQELLQKAQDLWKELVKLTQATNEQKKIYENGIEKNVQVSEELKKLKESLDEREKEIKSVEDLISLAKETDEKIDKIKKDFAELETQRIAFVSYSEQVKNENLRLKETYDAGTKENEELKIKLDKEFAELEHRKKTLKEEVIKESVGRIWPQDE